MKTVIEEKLNEIKIPNDLHERCVAGVMKAKKELKEEEITVKESKMEEKRMKKNDTKKNTFKKIAATAAILAVGIVAVGSTTMADGIKGFFKDVTRFDGAVTGTQYLQATDEVKMSVSEALVEEAKTNLSVDLVFLNLGEAPFKYLEFVEVDEFEIRDEDGNIIISAEDADAIHSINNGNAKLQLVIEKELVKGENYTLVIESFEGSKKADAPLEIKGAWECEFITH